MNLISGRNYIYESNCNCSYRQRYYSTRITSILLIPFILLWHPDIRHTQLINKATSFVNKWLTRVLLFSIISLTVEGSNAIFKVLQIRITDKMFDCAIQCNWTKVCHLLIIQQLRLPFYWRNKKLNEILKKVSHELDFFVIIRLGCATRSSINWSENFYFSLFFEHYELLAGEMVVESCNGKHSY